MAPFEKVPGNEFGDFEFRLSGIIDFHSYGSGGVSRVLLNEFRRKAKLAKVAQSFVAQIVLANAAGRNAVFSEQRGDVGEVGGRSA